MTPARNLLQELAGIGATIEPAGTELILRAGPTAIPAALVRRVKDAKCDLIAMLNRTTCGDEPGELRYQVVDRRIERSIIDWLNEHPAPSPAGRCAWCGDAQSSSAIILPFGINPGTHTWLHAPCWVPWRASRRADAERALKQDETST